MIKTKLKNVCDIYTGNSISDSLKDNYLEMKEGCLPYISTKDIDSNTGIVNYYNDMFINPQKEKFKVAPKDSILLCIEGGSAGKKIGLLTEDVTFVNKLCCFKVKKKHIIPEYLYYYLQSEHFLSQFNLNITGLIGGVSQSNIKNFNIYIPSIEEQKNIVNYLKSKVKKIDEIISNNKLIIERFEELKSAIVINKINEKNYPCGRLKLYMYESNARNNDENAELLSVFTKLGVDYRKNMEDRGNKSRTVLNYKMVKKDDMIVNKLLAWMGAFGVSPYNGVTSPDYDVYKFRNNSYPKFYHYYFRYSNFKNDCYKYGHGIMLMRWRTYSSELLNIQVPHPDYEEQINLSKYFEMKFEIINNQINGRKEIINKLIEYKKAVIYSAMRNGLEV